MAQRKGSAPLAARPGAQPAGLCSLCPCLFFLCSLRKPFARANASTLKSLSFGYNTNGGGQMPAAVRGADWVTLYELKEKEETEREHSPTCFSISSTYDLEKRSVENRSWKLYVMTIWSPYQITSRTKVFTSSFRRDPQRLWKAGIFPPPRRTSARMTSALPC